MTLHAPILDFAAARQAMVDSQLRPQGVADPAVLAAMGSVAREDFVPDGLRPLAYADRSLALGNGRFMSPPAVLGQLLTQMGPMRGERALVVGAGTGYSASVLARMGCAVTALECDPGLAGRARQTGLDVIEGPLPAGAKRAAPYNLILIDGAVEHVPDTIVTQLAEGGRLGAVLVERGVGRLIVGRRAGGGFGYMSIGDAGVAMLPGFSRPREFRF